MSKIKILISTDSAAIHSGLAETTRNIFLPLLSMYPNKYHIEQLGFFHAMPREKIPWPIHQTRVNQTPQGPQLDMADKYGEQSFHHVVRKVAPDIVFGFGDMWHFNHILGSPMRNTYRMCAYYTIDGQPYYGHLNEDGTSSWGDNLKRADQVVVMSHFGVETLKASCKELAEKDIKVAYHPLDMRRHIPKSPEQKIEIRKSILPEGIPDDAFICGWLGRNQFRKQNYKLWETLYYIKSGNYIECQDCKRITIKEYNHSARRLKDPSTGKLLDQLTTYDPGYNYEYCWYCKSSKISHGEENSKFYLWLHMPKADPGYNPDLHERIWQVSDRCLYTNSVGNAQGISREDVANLISTWDCLYYPSGGEGFGIPSFECLASGIPIVYANYSSHAEFCRFGGLPIRVSYIPELHHGIMRSIIDTGDAIKQLLALMRSPELRIHLGNRGRVYASQYAMHHMAPVWDSIFTSMMGKPLPLQTDQLYGAKL